MDKKVFDNNGLEERMIQHQVEQLIRMSKSSSESPEEDIFPDQSEALENLIDQYGEDQWIFYSSVTLFSMNIGAILKDYDRLGRINLTSIVSKELKKADPKLINAIENFRKFSFENEDDEEQQIANIGLWLVWNLKQETPAKDDFNLVAALGKLQVEKAKEIRESMFHRGLN